MYKNEKGISEKDVFNFMNDTGKLMAKKNASLLGETAIAANSSNSLTNEVEFWKWMGRNYAKSGIFDNSRTIQEFVNSNSGREVWMEKVVQGKRFEWAWMTMQRNNFQNIFKRYDAGDIANRMGSDVSEINLLNGNVKEYQMKAYTSNLNPHLKNTPKDMAVVTNSEKVNVVKQQGYEEVSSFKNSEQIKQSNKEHLKNIKEGKIQTGYNIQNVAGTMAKAGLVGAAVGVTVETIFSYKDWKNGKISDEEYLKRIMKAGGNSGITAGLTSGVMIPVSAAITALGISSLVTIPVAFVIGAGIDKVVAPCFGRGNYRKYLNQAKYYQNLQIAYQDLAQSMENSSRQYFNFLKGVSMQQQQYFEMRKKSKEIDKDLEILYNSI